MSRRRWINRRSGCRVARVLLTLLLPTGSEPGSYEVEIWDSGAAPQVSVRGHADLRNYVMSRRSMSSWRLHRSFTGGVSARGTQGRQRLAILSRGNSITLPIDLLRNHIDERGQARGANDQVRAPIAAGHSSLNRKHDDGNRLTPQRSTRSGSPYVRWSTRTPCEPPTMT